MARGRGPFTTPRGRGRYGLDVERDARRARGARPLVRGELRPGASSASGATPTSCAASAAPRSPSLRREVEPAEQAALGRFLPGWHGIDRRATLAEALVPLQGLPLPVSLWETESCRAACPGYQPASLDELCATGEVVWIGAGLDRVALFFRDDAPLLGPPARRRRARGRAHDALRAALATAPRSGPTCSPRPTDRTDALAALWELVWNGEVTNDAWAPLRARRRYGIPTAGAARGASRGRARPGTSRRSDGGRSPRGSSRGGDRRALAELLLERQGIVTRDGVRAEGVVGGYGAVYGELKALETVGACRRGYFVEGLGGAQFALPGAVERLRELRDASRDRAARARRRRPAQPYGGVLPWPKRAAARAARVAGAHVVLLGGAAALLRRARRPVAAPAARAGPGVGPPPAIDALVAWVRADRGRRLAVSGSTGVSW